jgi:hypothetical protein
LKNFSRPLKVSWWHLALALKFAKTLLSISFGRDNFAWVKGLPFKPYTR